MADFNVRVILDQSYVELVLQPLPNQSFSAKIGDDLYIITIKEAFGIMACDIIRNDLVIQTGARIVGGTPLIPYDYLTNGNFILITQNEDYPFYLQFGITQYLIYATDLQLEALKSATKS